MNSLTASCRGHSQGNWWRDKVRCGKMSETIKIKSTSKNSAIGEDIVLRATKTTRLVFRPELVNNPHNRRASVRGTFIFQKKNITGHWEDYKELDLSKLKKAEWVKIELKAGELYTLLTELNNYYKIFELYGIKIGETEFLITSQNIRQIIQQLMQDKANLNKLLEQGGIKLLSETIQWLSGLGDIKLIIEKLKNLKTDDLTKLNSMISFNCLNNILDIWKTNKNNKSEDFWQNLFKHNSWILAQIFSHPMVIFKDKAYVGGKSIDNQGGNIVDFIYKNNLTENSVLIEIKTPVTKLLSNQYRDNVYSVSNDLSGSINQILSYKDELQRNFYSLIQMGHQKLQAFNPKCIVIIGCLETEKLTDIQQRSLEMICEVLKFYLSMSCSIRLNC